MFLLLAAVAVAAVAYASSSSSSSSSSGADPLADPLAYDANLWAKAFATVPEPLRTNTLTNLQYAQKKDVPQLYALANMVDALVPPQKEAAAVIRARAKAIAAGKGP